MILFRHCLRPHLLLALLITCLAACPRFIAAQQVETAVAENAPTIGRVGQELIDLIASLAEGERNPSVRLSLEPVLRRADRAVQSLPSLQSIQAARRLAEAQKDESAAARLPQVSVNVGGGQRQYDFFSTRYSGGGQSQSVTGRQLIYDFGATNDQVSAATYRVLSAGHREGYVQSELLLRALEAFYDTQRSVLQVRLARENLQARRTFVSYIRQRAELGASTSADVVRSEARVAESLDQLSIAMQRLSVNQTNYRQFYGEDAEPYILPTEPNLAGLLSGSANDMMVEHPLALESLMTLEAAKLEKEASRAKLYGGAYLELTAGEVSDPGRPPQRNDTAFIVYRAEIYSGGSQLAKIAQNTSRLEQAQAELDRVRIEIVRTLREAESEHAGYVAAVSARLLVFDATRDAYAISKELYSFSRGSLYDVFRAQEDLFNAGSKLIDGLIDRAKSGLRVLHTKNRLLDLVRGNQCAEGAACHINTPSPK